MSTQLHLPGNTRDGTNLSKGDEQGKIHPFIPYVLLNIYYVSSAMLVTANRDKDITKWLQDIVHNVWKLVKQKAKWESII